MEEINTNMMKENEKEEKKEILNNLIHINEEKMNENNNNLDKYILCPICNNEYNNIRECESCHKVFCEECIKKYLEKNKTCPSNCKEVNLKSNKIISNIIEELIKIKSFRDLKTKTIIPTKKNINKKTENNNSNIININNIYEEKKEEKKIPLVEDINKYDYKMRFEDLFKDFSKFKSEFNKVNDENFNLRKENWNLKTENINLIRKKDDLVRTFEKLNRENKERNGNQQIDFRDLSKLYRNKNINTNNLDNFNNEIDLLKDEVSNLRKEESELRNNNLILKEKNIKLNNEIQNLIEEMGYNDDYQDEDDEIDSKKKKTEWF